MNALIEDNPAERRFEALVDDSLAGFVTYQVRPEAVVLAHTEVEQEFAGQGVGSALARGVLDQLRARGDRVVVQCPFIAHFIESHPEYADLLVSG